MLRELLVRSLGLRKEMIPFRPSVPSREWCHGSVSEMDERRAHQGQNRQGHESDQEMG